MYKYKLSIVVAVYNLEKYLPRCLDALVNQTLKEIEIICVDDGSTDSAPQIIDEYAKKYPERVKAFHKENGGEFTTRNYGLQKATGEYVTFVDTDDYVEKDWAEKLYNVAKRNNADLAVCGFERIDLRTNKVVAKNMNKNKFESKEISGNDDFVCFINPAPWNKIYKTELVQNFSFLPFRGFNDALFLITCYTKMKKIAFTNDVLYHYYLRYDSQIHTVNKQDVENLKRYLLSVKQIYEENKKEYIPILELMAFIHLGTSVMYRASYDKTIDIREMLKETIEYLDKNFTGWRKSRFLKLGYSIKKGPKHMGLYVISKLYKWNMPMIYIKLYRFMVDVLNIDIKF